MSHLTIYKASAGSGKTFTLAAKYVAFLLSGEGMAHARLLAVTFTNKATGEMKERILAKLYSIAYGTDDRDGFLCAVVKNLSPSVCELGIPLLRARAKDRLQELLHDYDHFTVQTIDSFFQSLLSNLAHELGLAANFRVEINDKEVFAKAVDNIMRRIAMAEQGNAQDKRLRHWVSKYIRERLDNDKNWKISDSLKDFARQLFSDTYIRHEHELLAILNDDERMDCYKRELLQTEKLYYANMRQHAELVHENIMQQGGCDTAANSYTKIFGGNGYRWLYSSYLVRLMNGDFSKSASATICKWMEKPVVGEQIRQLEQEREAAQIDVNSLQLARANIDRLRLLGAIAEEVEHVCDEENHFMLARTPILFQQLIGEEDACFVMERAGNRFEHVMIDEFQDTSPLQWNNFEQLLINNTAQGQECLVVGDVKQSIYRWRGGDWRKLNELADKNAQTTYTLDRNFRSAEKIIEFNNAVFTQAPDAASTPWPNDASQLTNSRKGGYVRVKLSKAKQTALEELFLDVAENARELIRVQGISPKDMAILIRSNKDANDLIDYFHIHYPDLPLVSSEAFYLNSSRGVQRLVAALRYLCDVGRPAAEKDAISEEYLRMTGGIPEEFVAQRVSLARRPLYELCETIICLFRLDGEEDDAPFLFHFLDQVLEYLEENPSTLREFLAYWEGTLQYKSIPGGEMDGIRIISVHKSKGLDFHTVLIPFCQWQMEVDRSDNILWCERRKPPFDVLPALPISLSAKMRDSVFCPEYEQEHLEQRTENLNLLYVAFTRAVQNLLVWGNVEGRSSTCADLLASILPQIEGGECIEETTDKGEFQSATYTFGSMSLENTAVGSREEAYNPFVFKAEEENVALTLGHTQVSFRQSSKALEFLAQQEEDTRAELRKAYIQEGTLLHEVFSRIKTFSDIATALESVQREGLVDAAWVKQHEGFVVSRVTSRKVREWFSDHWQVYNEQAIICPHPQRPMFTTRRPDRVITDGQRTLVIDFKFAHHDAGHVFQVEQYCQLLREMGFPQVEGYLWYVYNNEIVSICTSSK